jgi:regulator of protease activity HflC (stomatin/prohibitin superfamily)
MGMASIDVQIQKSEIEASAASKDMQEIKTHVAVNWSITPESVVSTYQQIGDEDDVLDRIISPAVSEAFKAAISKKTAEEVLAKRMELKTEIDEVLAKRLGAYGVTMKDVSIVNLTFSPEFTNAIEAKQIAEQQAQQAKYTAMKAIEQAKAEVNLAKGQAEAQALQRSTITPALLQKMAIDKWDGKFPQYMGAQSLPFITMKASQ